MMTLNALVAARLLVVPVEAQGMALSGVKALMEVVGQIQERMNPDLRVLRLVPCRVGRTVLARDVEAVLRQRYGDLVSGPRIPESVRIAEAPSRHQSITAYAPENAVAVAYVELANELSAELGLESRHAAV
jgi:chromosome partitioning protein